MTTLAGAVLGRLDPFDRRLDLSHCRQLQLGQREVNVIIDWIIGQISDRPPRGDVAGITKAPDAPAHLIVKEAPAFFKHRFQLSVARIHHHRSPLHRWSRSVRQAQAI